MTKFKTSNLCKFIFIFNLFNKESSKLLSFTPDCFLIQISPIILKRDSSEALRQTNIFIFRNISKPFNIFKYPKQREYYKNAKFQLNCSLRTNFEFKQFN